MDYFQIFGAQELYYMLWFVDIYLFKIKILLFYIKKF